MPVHIDRLRALSETYEWVEISSHEREVVIRLVHHVLKDETDYVYLDFKGNHVFEGDFMHLRSCVNAALRIAQDPEWWKKHHDAEVIPTTELK